MFAKPIYKSKNFNMQLEGKSCNINQEIQNSWHAQSIIQFIHLPWIKCFEIALLKASQLLETPATETPQNAHLRAPKIERTKRGHGAYMRDERAP